ncbi:hypothetical protein [Pandoraea oxalativorans]|uniref:Uncharacterized protein n=1 Tax=Pandoraea oxalativorans TaxID=573737 RepID=A0A0G3IHU1_9BURK|nr:hypothetical protein [Pandoraea oxalativorans]AKK24745.1 hypothetical protein MB84_28490 [Pandoraea oxalativorans]
MAIVFAFTYKGFRMLCTALPETGGGFRATAQISSLTPGVSHDDRVITVHGGVYVKGPAAIEGAASLARMWVDAHPTK